jgi:type VI secretion system protein ImpJ
MRTDQLARIDWQMGQTLLPEHLIAQEESLLADTILRFSLLGLPSFGVGRLKWNESLLDEGIVSIVQLALVLPNGQILDVPGNTSAGTMNLNLAGTTRVAIYIHLTSERTSVSAAGRRPTDTDTLDRVVQRVVLSSEQTHPDALQTFKLAEFEKDPEGVWHLAQDYLPPLLQVGTSPFLAGPLEDLGKLVELFHQQLEEDIAASYLGGEGLFSAKQCLRGVYNIRRFLANLRAQIHYHPYHVYEALKQFYIEVCLYKGTTPEHVEAPYLHDDLATCLRQVTEPLIAQIQVSRGKTPYLQFEKREGLFIVPQLPQEVRLAKELYFLVQKPRVSEVVSLEGVKLASRARLPIVHQLALQGIPYRKIERPPFQHGFGSEVEFYLLREGEEWDHALREGNVAFFDAPGLANAKAYLYWRTG